MKIAYGSKSHPGKVRENNEDYCAVDPALNLFIVCDGMGGQAAGEVASKMGADILLKHCRDMDHIKDHGTDEITGRVYSPATARLARGVQKSNAAVFEAGNNDMTLAGMGSTVVAVQINDNVMSLAHVGDSRVYQLRQEKLKQLTNDHSLVMEQVRLGMLSKEEVENSEMGNVILRALGAEPFVEVDLEEVWLQAGDTILLCSDGLSRMVPDEQIAQILVSNKDPQQAANQLVEAAINNGGEDNVTVIVIRLLTSKTGWLKKLAGIFQRGDGKWQN